MYIAHSNTFLPTNNQLSEYFIIIWHEGRRKGRIGNIKYQISKPLQLVKTNFFNLKKSSKIKKF